MTIKHCQFRPIMLFSLLVLGSLVLQASCYLELPLSRLPHSSGGIDVEPAECRKRAATVNTNQSVDLELCYLKDIAYAVELYHNDQLYMLGIDMTIPVSWIKSPDCKAAAKKCGRVAEGLRQKIRDEVSEVSKTVKQKVKDKIKGANKEAEDQEEASSNDDKHTVLGMDLITGTLEKSQNVEFWTKDSGKLSNFYKLILIGLFLSDEKDKLLLTSTNFINATSISPHINRLIDGAISLRFDDSSENSFLNEIFAYVGESDKAVTVYLGDNATVTIGELSTKNSEEGYAGITWLDLGSGKLPLFDQLAIQEEGKQGVKQVELSVEGVFTLSASYLSFPKTQLAELLKALNSKCEVLPKDNLYVQCQNTKGLLKKKLVYEVGEGRIVLELKELILKSKQHKVLLNIRESDADNPYLILGEPVFKKYYTAFMYNKNKIGIAMKRTTLVQTLFQIITLVRFLTFIFLTGCCFLICYRPIRRMIKTFRLYYKVNDFRAARDSSDRQGLRYSSEEENPYSDIAGKLQELAADSGEGL